MKANHNHFTPHLEAGVVVVNISKSKNESKSQLEGVFPIPALVVVNISKSKNESKSQLFSLISSANFVVVNISKSKNESKSQQSIMNAFDKGRCGKYQ